MISLACGGLSLPALHLIPLRDQIPKIPTHSLFFPLRIIFLNFIDIYIQSVVNFAGLLIANIYDFRTMHGSPYTYMPHYLIYRITWLTALYTRLIVIRACLDMYVFISIHMY
jgi:hypothetical protein